MGQAFIFEGEDVGFVRGRGLEFAKGLNCLENAGPQDAPCGRCASCRAFDGGNHPDTFYVKGTKQSGIGVDDVREQVLLPMAQKPFSSKYKVFILAQAETLTPAAQNALLKTIEEPAPYGVFLFIAPNTHGFLPTVLSRCVIHKIKGKGPAGENPVLLALAEEISETGELDIFDTFALYRKFEPLSKDELLETLDLLYGKFGEKIAKAAKTGQNPKKQWFAAAAAITNTKQILAQNGNTQLAVELMLLKMFQKEVALQ